MTKVPLIGGADHRGADSGLALPPPVGGVSRARRWSGIALLGAGLPALTAGLVGVRDRIGLDSVLLIYLLAVVVTAVVGGVLPAIVAALASFLLANWFLTPPYHTFVVAQRDQLIALAVFVAAAVLVSLTVEVGARDRAAAARNRMEVGLISRLSTGEADGRSVEALLRQVQTTFAMTSVALVDGTGDTAREVASVGPPHTGTATVSLPTANGLTLTAYGPEVFAQDHRLLRVLAATTARAWEERRLTQQAERAERLAETDRLRSSLLAAVSHDLRTPLAGIKAAVSGLRQPDITWAHEEQQELLGTIEVSADRLGDLISNLLAMSRLRAGELSVQLGPVALDEVVARALLGSPVSVRADIPDDLPLILADSGLLERVIANLIANACRYSPADRPVQLHARVGRSNGHRAVLLSVSDHGPGVTPAHWEQMFQPFQRLGDRDNRTGVGLGLAIARGFCEAMGATITPSTTDGGGLTMTVAVPMAQ
ncbi:MAG TPA: DUF4118 domain-containing protein [Dermatophilaceae bacterium]|nr:DUF4118 domain-containing protein [Dermatophilaceae bacterium]